MDYIDGSSSRYTKEPVSLDELDLFGIRMKLMERGVIGFTITKADMLGELAKHQKRKAKDAEEKATDAQVD